MGTIEEEMTGVFAIGTTTTRRSKLYVNCKNTMLAKMCSVFRVLRKIR